MLLFYIYLFGLLFAFISGIINVKYFDSATQIIFVLISITLTEELLNYVISIRTGQKAPIYHIYSVIEIFLTTIYFLKTIKFKYYRIGVVMSVLIWPSFGLLNIIYFQPINVINTNMLVLESIMIIIMALYGLYRIFINDSIHKPTQLPEFWIWTLFLMYWSSSFFFWGFFKIFHFKNQHYFNLTAYSFQEIVNIIAYVGIGLTFYYYPKMTKN